MEGIDVHINQDPKPGICKLQDLEFDEHKSVQSEVNRHEINRNQSMMDAQQKYGTRNWWTNKYENYRTH